MLVEQPSTLRSLARRFGLKGTYPDFKALLAAYDKKHMIVRSYAEAKTPEEIGALIAWADISGNEKMSLEGQALLTDAEAFYQGYTSYFHEASSRGEWGWAQEAYKWLVGESASWSRLYQMAVEALEEVKQLIAVAENDEERTKLKDTEDYLTNLTAAGSELHRNRNLRTGGRPMARAVSVAPLVFNGPKAPGY